MSAWIRQNWKPLALTVAGLVVVIVLYLRTRSGSGAAGQISFPAPPPTSGGSAGSDTGSSSTTPSLPNPFVKLLARPGYQGGLVGLFSSPGTGESVIALPGGTQLESAGQLVKGQFFSEGQYPGGSSFWQPVLYNGATYYVWAPDAPVLGQGGPGLADAAQNLGTAALAAEAGSHRTATLSARLSSRLRQDARQAVRESRRLGTESRGAAPIRRSASVRWPS